MFSKILVSKAALPLGLAAGFFSMKNNVAKCSGEDCIPPLDYGWTQDGAYSSYDYKSVRRGFQVYRQVCASCHSIELRAFRQLVGVTHDEAGAKKVAETYTVEDGPNEEGEMFERPGKLFDNFPGPYKNEEQGRMANNGAYPPDLSLITRARHYGKNYIVALLTGYVEAPAGKAMLPGLHYNPYFAGGAISMAKQLTDGQLEYEDGTPATESQMAKDVANFLQWSSEPEHDERKRSGVQFLVLLMVGCVLAGYSKRVKWAIHKTRKISYTNKYHNGNFPKPNPPSSK
jgi:ubiquinol-cytochrome c reductase cytochrome c1 subunit